MTAHARWVEAGGPASNVLSERSLSLYARRSGRYCSYHSGSENGCGRCQSSPGRGDLVDDDGPRTGLRAALAAADFDVVGEAEDAPTAVVQAEQLQPDVIVLDVLMPGQSGLEVVDKLLAAAPDTKVVLLTVSESEDDLLTGIKAGASGYVIKDTPFPSLATAITDVVENGAVVSPRMAAKLFTVVQQMLRHRELADRKSTRLNSSH